MVRSRLNGDLGLWRGFVEWDLAPLLVVVSRTDEDALDEEVWIEVSRSIPSLDEGVWCEVCQLLHDLDEGVWCELSRRLHV